MSRKHRHEEPQVSGAVMAAAASGLDYTAKLEEVAGEELVGTEDHATMGIRTILFDETGPIDLGSLEVAEVAAVVGQAVGEAMPKMTLPPVGQTVPADDTPSPIPEPRARMSADQLSARIRIAERWRSQCPKRPGTIAYANWQLYIDGMTVSAWLASHDRRRARTDLRWDLDHGFVYLQSSEEYEAEAQAEILRSAGMGEEEPLGD